MFSLATMAKEVPEAIFIVEKRVRGSSEFVLSIVFVPLDLPQYKEWQTGRFFLCFLNYCNVHCLVEQSSDWCDLACSFLTLYMGDSL